MVERALKEYSKRAIVAFVTGSGPVGGCLECIVHSEEGKNRIAQGVAAKSDDSILPSVSALSAPC